MEKRNMSIQLLRVCACLLVFFVHFGQRMGFSGVLLSFSNFGEYGVQLFLLISGFLAAKTFFDNENVNVLNYYKKRIIAILPLYYLVILYFFVSENILNQFVSVIPSDELGIGWLRYIFLLNGFLNSKTYFWSNLGITWTIPIFMFFYLIAPWILRRFKTVFSSVIVWAVVFLSTQIANIFYSCVIFTQLHFMFLGVVVYACVKNERHRIAILVFALSAIVTIILKNILYTYVSIFACIILAIVGIENIDMPKWLYNTVNVLDKYSYTMYLMHGVVFCSFLDRLNALEVSKILIAIIAIFGTFVATFIVGRFIEKPIQNFLKKKFLKA